MQTTAHAAASTDLIPASRIRLAQLEADRRLDAGRRRIIARALRAQGFTVREIARLLRVSRTQAYKDLTVRS